MATLNNEQVVMHELTFTELGDRLLQASPSGDGSGIVLDLSSGEEGRLAKSGQKPSVVIRNLIFDAIERETGQRPVNLTCTYDPINRRFSS